MSNRAQRRAAGHRGRITDSKAKVQRPIRQTGVEIDRVEDSVILTIHMGIGHVTVEWKDSDADHIADMIKKAAQGEDKEQPEVVHGSGLIIPGTGDVINVARSHTS